VISLPLEALCFQGEFFGAGGRLGFLLHLPGQDFDRFRAVMNVGNRMTAV
jgi:hypothetical protein